MIPGVTMSTRFQIATRSGFARRPVNTAGHVARMHEMLSQMRDVLEKDHFVTERNVIKQDKMLVKLSHVANMGNHRYAKLPAEQTDGDEFTHAADTDRVHLDESRAPGLQIIFE